MSKLPPSTAWSRFGLIFLGCGFLLVIGMLWLAKSVLAPLTSKHSVKPAAKVNAPAAVGSGVSGAVVKPDAATAAADKAAAGKESIEQLNKLVADTLAVLRNPEIKDKRAALDALRTALRGADPAVAIAAIRDFLASKEDAVTGLRFKVGQGGVLDEAPSMRTFMMDQLGSLSTAAGMPDAMQIARETLATKSSPDEWAVAMRNAAWADPQGSKAFLAEKARELIAYMPWQQLKSGGYLEAFDVIPYTGDPSFFNDLAPLSATPSRAQQAALVAMDRLAATSPDKTAAYLNSHPDILADRPLIRADYMGKVDLAAPDQRAQAETYLQRADVSLEEKTKFLARLGVPAGFVSNNLLTPPQQPMDIFARRDLVNQTATTWLNSGQFPALQAPLQQLITSTGAGG